MTTDSTVPASIAEADLERDRKDGPARGFEAAVEHIRLLLANPLSTEVISTDSQPHRSSLAKSQTGYVAIFKLVSLELVAKRFGVDGLSALRHAILCCLLRNLQPADRIYDLAQDTLVAVCDRRAHPVRQEQLAAELCRVLARNRDFPIQVGERKIMLRIPISVAIHPVSKLGNPCQLRELLMDPIPLQDAPLIDSREMPDLAVLPGGLSTHNETGSGG